MHVYQELNKEEMLGILQPWCLALLGHLLQPIVALVVIHKIRSQATFLSL